jgi:hypothetical protein
MASFCTNCGGPVEGRFCSKCGTAITSSPPVAPVAPAGVGSGAKIIIIVVAVCVGLGAVAVGSLVYVAHRAKQKLAELTREYSVSPVPGLRVQVRPPAGNGCPLLSGEEAAQILGVAIERVESSPWESGGTECKYWVSIAERQRLARAQIAGGLSGIGNNSGSDDKAVADKTVKDAAALVAGALNAVANSSDDATADFAFSLQVRPSGGKKEWEDIEHGHAALQAWAGLSMQEAAGVGDKAYVVPGGQGVMALKGDASLLLNFQAFAPGQDKAIALAKLPAGRL